MYDKLDREVYIPNSDYQNSRDYELIATVTGTDYLDNDVLNGIEYCYYVTASNVSGISDSSNIDCAEPYGLNSPSNLVATGEVGSIYLEWTAPPSAGDEGGGTDGGTDGGGTDGGDDGVDIADASDLH